MITKDINYFIISKNSNEYTSWNNDVYPEWSSIVNLRPVPNQKVGAGVEPHYHDNDEIWLFTKGHGEVWLDDKIYKITPNTIVYTPMGVIHRLQMFTEFEDVSISTRLEGKKRTTHILVEEHGKPEKTVPGFVVPGKINNGPFVNRGKRCPLTEIRQIHLNKNEKIEKTELAVNEYWTVVEGSVFIDIGKFNTQLFQGDVVLLKKSLIRELKTKEGCRLALARE